jgi:hypothetical protein
VLNGDFGAYLNSLLGTNMPQPPHPDLANANRNSSVDNLISFLAPQSYPAANRASQVSFPALAALALLQSQQGPNQVQVPRPYDGSSPASAAQSAMESPLIPPAYGWWNKPDPKVMAPITEDQLGHINQRLVNLKKAGMNVEPSYGMPQNQLDYTLMNQSLDAVQRDIDNGSIFEKLDRKKQMEKYNKKKEDTTTTK